jgi:hypothetical protein
MKGGELHRRGSEPWTVREDPGGSIRGRIDPDGSRIPGSFGPVLRSAETRVRLSEAGRALVAPRRITVESEHFAGAMEPIAVENV